MSNLVMAIRSVDGLILACDANYNLRNESCPNIKPLSDHLAVLIEPDVELGQRMLDDYLAQLGSPPGKIREFIEGCSRFILEKIGQDKPLPISGMICAGMDSIPQAHMELYGIHGVTGYREIRGFINNVFGGPLNAIARFLDRKMHSRELTLTQAKHLAAFYVIQSQLALGPRLDNYICLATITYGTGFRWVGDEELTAIIEKVAYLSNQVRSQCTSLFMPHPIGQAAFQEGVEQ